MYYNLLTSIIIIIIDNNYNILNNFLNINYISNYLLISFILTTLNSKHLQGTSYRKNKNNMPNYYILFLCKLNFIMLFYSLIFNSNLNNLFLLYLPSYLEFAEFKGFKYLSPPIRDNYYEVNNKFDDGILFAPSLLGCRTIDEKETELIGKWISFLESVIYKAELKRVGIKFHPSIALLEKNFIEISSLIKSKLPKAEIYAPKHDVMLLINDYKLCK